MRRHQRSVRSYLLYQGCPAHLADDLVQETFLSFLAARFEHRAEAATAAFLRKVARHLFLKAMERERRAPALMDEDASEVAWVAFEGEDGGRGYVQAMKDWLAKLRGRAAEVVALRYGAWAARRSPKRSACRVGRQGALDPRALAAARVRRTKARVSEAADLEGARPDPHDRIADHALREVHGLHRHPDLTARIVAAWQRGERGRT
ncbi:MAG: sigma-70 family RNA polymerase sigma factor [Planctomycetes bacterium]|nr:sigma-70 family RNA polymerase sigma factor [Planctomycetota bacterium]